MKVVAGFIEYPHPKTRPAKEMTETSHPHLLQKSFRSFTQVLALLKPGETVTTWHTGKGYRQVGIDHKHGGWVQRNLSYEY